MNTTAIKRLLTEFDEQVFGRRDDTLEVVFGQHKHAFVWLDGHLFLDTGVGDRRVNQQERCERYVKNHVVDSILQTRNNRKRHVNKENNVKGE